MIAAGRSAAQPCDSCRFQRPIGDLEMTNHEENSAIKRHLPLIALTTAASLLFSAQASAILGGGVSGNKFKYEACGKIVEGKTTYQEAEKMLEGEPISTGKTTAGFFRHYQYEKQGGIGLRTFGIGVGGSKAKSYKCFVVHNASGVITMVDMQETGVDGTSTGL